MRAAAGSLLLFLAGRVATARPVELPARSTCIRSFMHANFPPQPLWFEEGTAEFYGSFRATDREARIGLPVEDHIARLRESKMIPLERLFAVDSDSPEYSADERRGVFYAESWALVHYLLRGNPSRTPQLGRFLVLLKASRATRRSARPSRRTTRRPSPSSSPTSAAGRWPLLRNSRPRVLRPTRASGPPRKWRRFADS
jgi:hypothetical protein